MPKRADNPGRRNPKAAGRHAQATKVELGPDGDSQAQKPNAADRPARRAEVLEAATTLFYQRGYAATTTQDIGNALGLLKGSLYYYIDSKEDLLYEIIRDVHDEGLRRIEQLQHLPIDSLSKLRIFIQRGVSFVTTHPRQIRIFLNDGRSLSTERQEHLREERLQYDHYLRKLIATGQGDGSVCPDIDSHIAATSIVGLINWISYWYRPDSDIPADSLAVEYADLILNGLACDPQSHSPGHRGELGRTTEQYRQANPDE